MTGSTRACGTIQPRYKRVSAPPQNGARRRTLFLFFLLTLALAIHAALTLRTRPDNVVIVASHDEEERVPCLENALSQRRRTKQ
jgi:hypothetical protein